MVYSWLDLAGAAMPSAVEFFAKDWTVIGSRESHADWIATITGISLDVLQFERIETRSVAQRMSWAACSQTSRLEDIAYSLLGIFDKSLKESLSLPPVPKL